MLLQSYQLDVVNNHCMPGAQSVNCIARLEQDVGCAIPYLNAVIEGDQFTPDPPSVTFKTEGRLISVTERTITVNAVEDEAQGRKIIEWIKREINDAWEDRANIEPRTTKAERPKLIEILKRLPKTNCKKCGAPTCMVFATWVVQGAKDESQCPELKEEDKRKLHDYLAQFTING
ncbi:MAG: Fe-S cluster protein [Deltaproteobacteria bacterium]|nr:Fe-S cluster protein [Deltaproteobacteria bacterium]